MKAAFYTLGCKVNQYETQLMAEALEQAGYEIVDCAQNADVYIVNSCTVTAASNQKTRQSLRAFKRKHPESIMVLAGCMSQAYPKEAEALSEADIIIGNTEHKHLAQLIEDFKTHNKRQIALASHTRDESFECGTITAFAGKTRAEMKIEDGCNRYCSYCAIPYARGFVRSKPLESIRSEATALAAAGFREIVLVGINLSAYNFNGADIADAVQTVAAVEGIARVRLGSLEPDHITEDIITRLACEDKFCAQFHISLQSGCDKTLKAMNRHYTATDYAALCKSLRARFSDCSITTDIMVGFPGESEEDFEASYRFAKEIGFEKMHVFPYSVRAGTKAATMPEQISKAVKNQRAKKMLALAETLRREHFEKEIGNCHEVLFETEKGGYFYGHTKNYIPIKVKTSRKLSGEIYPVSISDYDDEYCIGIIQK
ncbi:MAG: tRNA (N(6)-L-threonylcarbamoyladenosine(37)-C(2))-methylthiotransferase MtaB [Ruminococcaceae bacterium]|nr:tRNA (N(6)-L-threonylcarbamoyladenosine(37)-C(2))-methylthiotransferase MtaB [Oscillospiraceae bacterium]